MLLPLLDALHVLVILRAGSVIELLERSSDFLAAEAGFFGQGDDPLRDDGELALAALHVVAAIFDPRFELGEPLALAGHRRQVSGETSSGRPSARSWLSNWRGPTAYFSSASLSRRSADVISWATSRRWLSTGRMRSSSARCRSACCRRSATEPPVSGSSWSSSSCSASVASTLSSSVSIWWWQASNRSVAEFPSKT